MKLKERLKHRILLLGAGGAGKTTILRQMDLMHRKDKKFTPQERSVFRDTIRYNLLNSMCQLVRACNELCDAGIIEAETEIASRLFTFEEQDESQSRKKCPVLSKALRRCVAGPPEDLERLTGSVLTIWKDVDVKRVLRRRSEFEIMDSFAYFIPQVKRIFARDYVPSTVDVLRCRKPTCRNTLLEFKERFRATGPMNTLQIVDVGGQRAHRGKWIHQFSNVSAVLFVASLSEYDNLLEEKRNRNCMTESLELFEGVCSLECFRDTEIVLLLNKWDLFQEKVGNSDFGEYSPVYRKTKRVA